ncbi:MAG: hypothetical protein KQH83_05895 [Actinobacteria bacterium]|nr:hypothetical protein [Actinomycetota bacterium]
MDDHDDAYVARSEFQVLLDRHFPRGAVCALLPVQDGRVQAAGWVEATGRLFCSGTRRSRDEWEYEVLIDTRTGEVPAEELRVWIGALRPHPTVGGLWEAGVCVDGKERMLRLNAAAPQAAMPGRAGRDAVTRAHEADLFPQGIG